MKKSVKKRVENTGKAKRCRNPRNYFISLDKSEAYSQNKLHFWLYRPPNLRERGQKYHSTLPKTQRLEGYPNCQCYVRDVAAFPILGRLTPFLVFKTSETPYKKQ